MTLKRGTKVRSPVGGLEERGGEVAGSGPVKACKERLNGE